ncbi:MAG: DUF3795 domain-containing protein [Chloroflexota bacterium]
MDTMLAMCGLVCTDCPAYQATQADDAAWLERIAAEWREQYNAPAITAEAVRCNGCLVREGKQCSHCAECQVRACAVARGVENCGACPDYGCETISALLAYIPDAKIRLDAIHAAL